MQIILNNIQDYFIFSLSCFIFVVNTELFETEAYKNQEIVSSIANEIIEKIMTENDYSNTQIPYLAIDYHDTVFT